jgi:hypothetical protein
VATTKRESGMSKRTTRAKSGARKGAVKKTARKKRATKPKGLDAKVRGYSKDGLAYAKGLKD